MIAALRALEVKLAEAKAPSRELDGEIACIAPLPEVWADENRKRVNDKNGKISFGKHGPGYFAPGYTSSLDAAVSFAEAVLPGQPLTLSGPWTGTYREVTRTFWQADAKSDFYELEDFTTEAPMPSLALCLAVIRALIARDEHE